MTTSWEKCQEIGEKGMSLIENMVRVRSRGRYIRTDHGRYAKQFQRTHGDYIVNKPGTNEMLSIEVKTEERHTGNLFLEQWSNRSRSTPGWMLTLDSDRLYYVFLENNVCYEMDFQALKLWLPKTGDKFDLKPGEKYEQPNDPWGRIVPIGCILEGLGHIGRSILKPDGDFEHTEYKKGDTISEQKEPVDLLFASQGGPEDLPEWAKEELEEERKIPPNMSQDFDIMDPDCYEKIGR